MNEFCDKREITLNPEWLPRNLNEKADFLSKSAPADDWSTSCWVFDQFSRAWGQHDVDRFSSNLNSKCHILKANTGYQTRMQWMLLIKTGMASEIGWFPHRI